MPSGSRGTDGLAAELAQQRAVFGRRDARVYGRTLEHLPEVLAGPAGRALARTWRARRFYAAWDRPLLLLAALRYDALREGPSHPLFAAFAADPPRADAVTAEALAAALDPARERVYQALARRTLQTNEPSRAVAWLWPAALAGLSNGARPVALADIGASAGLNLVADLLPAIWTDETGAPLDVARGVAAVARLGLDPAPIDVMRDEDADWLRACVWPEQSDRLQRLEAAIAAFRLARPRPDGPVLAEVAATAVPARLDVLSGAERGAVVLAYQTVMREYLPPDERTEYEAGMRDWLASHPPAQALWVELEPGAGGDLEHPAEIVAHVRGLDGEVHDLPLARCWYHPTRIVRVHAGVDALRAVFAPQAVPATQP